MRLPREEVAFDPVTCEVLADMRRGDRLVRRRIDRVDAEQPLQELGDFFSQPGVRLSLTPPSSTVP